MSDRPTPHEVEMLRRSGDAIRNAIEAQPLRLLWMEWVPRFLDGLVMDLEADDEDQPNATPKWSRR